jgi:hypothetical protein
MNNTHTLKHLAKYLEDRKHLSSSESMRRDLNNTEHSWIDANELLQVRIKYHGEGNGWIASVPVATLPSGFTKV